MWLITQRGTEKPYTLKIYIAQSLLTPTAQCDITLRTKTKYFHMGISKGIWAH